MSFNFLFHIRKKDEIAVRLEVSGVTFKIHLILLMVMKFGKNQREPDFSSKLTINTFIQIQM